MDSQDSVIPAKTVDNHKPLSRSAQRASAAAKRQAAQQQKILLLLLGTALVINLAVAYLLHGILILDKQAHNLATFTQQEANIRGDQVARHIQQQAQIVDKLVAAPAVAASLDTNNPLNTAESRQLLALKWMRKSPALLHLQLFPLDTANLVRDTEFPIRFAELDLIRRAEKNQQPLPELVAINERWMINWARPLVDAETTVLGSFLVRFDAHELLAIVNAADPTLGEYILQQQFAGSPEQIVLKVGAGNAAASATKKIGGSYLQVKFTPSAKLVANAQVDPSSWIMSISLIAIISLLAAWALSKVLRVKVKQPTTLSVSEVAQLSTEEIRAAEKSADANLANPLFQHQDILDIAVIQGDEDILGLNHSSGKKISGGAKSTVDADDVPADIFRAYDIRGIVGSQLTPELALKIGHAVGSEALDQGETHILVARDGRTHSEALTQALIRGILRSGCNVINIGVVPTPLLYFATFHFDHVRSGVMVTASHNAKEYNGFKVVMNNNALADNGVMNLRQRILTQQLHQGLGTESTESIIPEYIERIFSDVALAGNVSMVIDAGNAVTGVVAPQLFEELGCDVIPLFCDLDGEFPNHDPDPTIAENLRALIAKVQEVNADIGVAFDGDGDRLVVVTPKGDIIWPDRLLMLFAKDILARNPGADVLFDVKCSRQLNQIISSYGGRPIMWKTGHSHMKAKMLETGALIGGEYSGHIFIKDRWYGFDDGIYAMARLLEIITLRDQKIDDIFAAFPPLLSTPEIKIPMGDQDKLGFIATLIEQAEFQGGTTTTIDGLRVDFPKGWGLVRASNTSPALTLRFEAESQEVLEKIQHIFKQEMLKVDKNLTLNF